MNQKLVTRRTLACLLIALSASVARADDGPTPYPDQKDEAAWPGKGPIRVGNWMTDNRKGFWANREKDQGKIVLVGDSLLGGWKPDLLAQNFPNLKIANRAIGGDVSRGVLFRFKEDVIDLKPSALVLCVGTNDLSTHADPSLAESNLTDILAMAREYSATMPIVLCTIPPRDVKNAPVKPGHHEQINAIIKKLGEGKEHIVVIDTYGPMAGDDGKPKAEYFRDDKIHPSPAGYDKWAELLKPAFASLGVK